jgi:hypothetical protein
MAIRVPNSTVSSRISCEYLVPVTTIHGLIDVGMIRIQGGDFSKYHLANKHTELIS